MKNFNKESGQMSKIILILAGAIFLLVVIIFIAVSIVGSRSQEEDKTGENQEETEIPQPVYETTIGDIRFVLQSSVDVGNTLKATTAYQQNLTTTDRFVRVTVSAQNKGKNETASFSWELGSIVDSEGRVFIPITNRAYYFLPQPDLCGAILKPEFTPIPCVRIYEVSKASKDLKVIVTSKVPKVSSAYLDLKLP